MEEIIQVRHLKKYFKEIKAVDDVCFSVYKGEVFGFLGENGAGKTTTINMLCTLLAPTEGEVMIDGFQLGFSHLHFYILASNFNLLVFYYLQFHQR